MGIGLERRPFKVKNPTTSFLCPLCGTQRALPYRSRLTSRNYVQLAITSLALMILTLPLFKWGVIFVPLLGWGIFEASLKILFRKEIPCPYCGFDATWYKKDVRVAKKIVEQFWNKDFQN